MVILSDKKRKKRRIFAWAGGIVRREKFSIGGKLYYINPNGDGEYIFYDSSDNEISEAQVQQAFTDRNHNLIDSLVSYSVIKKGLVDKYYVYHDQLFTSKRWTYYDPETIVEGDPRYNAKWPGYAFKSLGTSNEIGAGKTNTELVMSADDGKYITNNSNGVATVWYTIQQMRDNKLGDCDDWFLPSRLELEELRKAIGFVALTPSDEAVIVPAGAVTGGVIAGVADGQLHYRDYTGENRRMCYPSATKFLDNYFWCSTESSTVYAWYWSSDVQRWNSFYKAINLGVVGVRAF